MAVNGVIFDLDGTLVDTLADLAGAMNYALGRFGEPGHSVDACRKMIGNGVRTFMSRALADDKQGLGDEAVKVMLAYYHENCTVKSRLYDGIAEVVRELGEKGVRLAVLTNKGQSEAERVVGHFFDEGTFEYVVGVDEKGIVKPDVKLTMGLLDAMGLGADEVLLVGDSDVDVLTAAGVGMRPIGAAWGFRGRDELLQAGADVIIDEPGEIVDLVSNS